MNEGAAQVRFELALALGDVWALDQLWRELGFGSLAGVFPLTRYSAAAPTRMTKMHHAKVTKALGQVAQEGVRAIALQHQVYEQAMVLGRGANRTNAARQHVMNAFPLLVSKDIAAAHATLMRAS